MPIAGKLPVDTIQQFAGAIRQAKRVMPELRLAQILALTLDRAGNTDHLQDEDLVKALYAFISRHERKVRIK